MPVPVSLDALRRLLLSLEHDPLERDRPPLFFEMGCLPAERYPALHERQIEENLQWARERERRVYDHARRVEQHRLKFCHREHPERCTHGKRQAVWCVELRRPFGSLTDAAEFVGRAASNVSQAIRLRVKCGPYHWEHFDAAKHPAQAAPAAEGVGHPAKADEGDDCPLPHRSDGDGDYGQRSA